MEAPIEYKGFVIDPSVLNAPERLNSFIESELGKDYTIAFSSDLRNIIIHERWEQLSAILQSWEWNVKRNKLIKWHRSSEFKSLCKKFIYLVSPCKKIFGEFTEDEREELERISEIMGEGSPKIIKIAKELLKTSLVKRFPIISYTKHAKRWFKDCKNVIITVITDAKNFVAMAKKSIKKRVTNAGWRGHIAVFFFGLVPVATFGVAFPPPIGPILGTTGTLIVGVMANGKKIE